jgi:hypothetical protein
MKDYFLSDRNIPWNSGRLNTEIMELHLRAPNTNAEEDRKVITSINNSGEESESRICQDIDR